MEMHFATSGFIVNSDSTKVLMVYHKKLDTWVIPGGHLEPNEYPADGAVREVFEETGIHARLIDTGDSLTVTDTQKETKLINPFVMLGEYIPEKGDKPAHTHIDFIFLGTADDKTLLKRQETEVENVKWFNLLEVPSMKTFNSIKQIAQKILDKGGVHKCVSLGS